MGPPEDINDLITILLAQVQRDGKFTYTLVRPPVPKVKKISKADRAIREKSIDWKSWLARSIKVARLRDRGCDLSVRYLAELLAAQKGLCAISGLRLSHSHLDLYGCSISLINNDNGFRIGNVRLVCRWVIKCGVGAGELVEKLRSGG